MAAAVSSAVVTPMGIQGARITPTVKRPTVDIARSATGLLLKQGSRNREGNHHGEEGQNRQCWMAHWCVLAGLREPGMPREESTHHSSAICVPSSIRSSLSGHLTAPSRHSKGGALPPARSLYLAPTAKSTQNTLRFAPNH
jgi:hypothetical protein